MQNIGLWIIGFSLMVIQSIAWNDPLIASATANEYGPVKSGQSLWTIAQEIRPDNSVTFQQVFVALWILNPQAFSRACNPNFLKEKALLKIPDKTQIASVEPKEAERLLQRALAKEVSEATPCTLPPLPTSIPTSKPPEPPPSASNKPVAPVSVAEKNPESLYWLELDPDVLKYWHAEISPEQNAVMNITPKWEQTPEQPVKKILGLIPKPSDSYSLASSKLLEILHEEGIYATITLINFNKDNELGKAAIQRAEQQEMDLIFSMGSESAAFFHEFYNGGKIPVVTCTNKDPVLLQQIADYENGSGTNIAYTSLNVPIDIQINYLTDLIHGLKNLGILYDRNHAQVVATEVIPTKAKLKEMNIQVIDVEVTSTETAKEDLLKNIASAVTTMQQNDPDLQYSAFWVTSSTLVFSNMATVAQASGAVPILGSIPNIVTAGDDSAVMAIGIDRRNNALLASIYAVKILKGQARVGELKVGVVTPPDIAVNFRAAKKLRLEIPFHLFESASFIYGYSGNLVRSFGQDKAQK